MCNLRRRQITLIDSITEISLSSNCIWVCWALRRNWFSAVGAIVSLPGLILVDHTMEVKLKGCSNSFRSTGIPTIMSPHRPMKNCPGRSSHIQMTKAEVITVRILGFRGDEMGVSWIWATLNVFLRAGSWVSNGHCWFPLRTAHWCTRPFP